MRLVTFQAAGSRPQPGVVVGEQVISLEPAGFPDLLSIIRSGTECMARIEAFCSTPPKDGVYSLASVKLLPPVPRPPKILCIGLNYRDHAEETNMPLPVVPTVFVKLATALIGHGESIVLPRASAQPDYEAELAFVIGKGGRHIPAGRWREHVFGYTIFNDVSARDFQKATSQWTMGKNFDTFAPMGPALVTADEVADPHALDISLTLNGAVMQSSNTRNLVFKIPDLVAFISGVCTLEPGDVISTGTPAGVGFARKPPVYLRPGDEVIVRIQSLGELRNPVISE